LCNGLKVKDIEVVCQLVSTVYSCKNKGKTIDWKSQSQHEQDGEDTIYVSERPLIPKQSQGKVSGVWNIIVIYRTWDGCEPKCTLCTLVGPTLTFLIKILVIHLAYCGFLDNLHLRYYISLQRMEKSPFSALRMPEKGFCIYR
jgi:hypothetical protein